MSDDASKKYEFENWADTDVGWNPDTAEPCKALVGSAIQAWSIFQRRPVSVAEAAAVFNLMPQRIIEAVEDFYWMYLSGPSDDYERLMIEHDGE